MKIRTLVEDPILDEGVSIIALIIGAGALVHVFMHSVDMALMSTALLLFTIVMIKSTVVGLLRKRDVTSDLLAFAAFAIALVFGDVVTAGLIAFAACLCRFICDAVANHAHSGIRTVVENMPSTVCVVRDGGIVNVPVEQVAVGDVVRVKWKMVMPFDGTIVKGNSFVDSSVLVSEKEPRYVSEGDMVTAGSLNIFGQVHVKVSASWGYGTAQKLEHMLSHMDSGDSPVTHRLDFIRKCIIPSALVISLATFLLSSDAVASAELFALISLTLTTASVCVMALLGETSPKNVLCRFAYPCTETSVGKTHYSDIRSDKVRSC